MSRLEVEMRTDDETKDSRPGEDEEEDRRERAPAPREEAAPPGGRASGSASTEGPPPLPPLLEIGASTATTVGAGAWAVGGPLGLAAVGAVGAGAAAAAYARRRRAAQRRQMARQSGATKTTRTRTLSGGKAAGRRGGGGLGALGKGKGAGGAGTGAGGRKGTGAGAGAGKGAGRVGRGGAGAGRVGRGGAGAGRSGGPLSGSGRSGGRGAGRSGGSRGRGTTSSTGWGGLGPRAGKGSGGRRGSGLFGGGAARGSRGRGTTSSTGWGGLGPRAAKSSAGGRHRGGGGRAGGSWFGGTPGAGRWTARDNGTVHPRPRRRPSLGGARRLPGRSHTITDPALPTRTAPRRPRTVDPVGRARAGARRAWRATKPHAVKVRSYLGKRVWAMQARAYGHRLRGWWGGIWERWTGRVSRDARYGRMRGVQLGLAAASVAAIGAGDRTRRPRVLVGRVIGRNAPSPQDGPIAAIGRGALAITTGIEPGEDPDMTTQTRRIQDASSELERALGEFGDLGMLEYERGLKELTSVFEAIGRGLDAMSRRSEDEMPVATEVLEFLGTIAEASRGSAQVAEELPSLFRAVHEVELNRLENPRANEYRWDISQQN